MRPTWKGLLLNVAAATMASADEVILPMQTSEFTTMISSIQIGVPAQSVNVGLSFASSVSWFHSPGGCPAFVSCFQTSLSETYEFLGEERSVTVGTSKLSGFVVADSIHLGESVQSEYVQVSQIEGLSMDFRDVAGSLALGPMSDLGSYYRILVAVDSPIAPKGALAVPRWSVIVDPELAALEETQIEVKAALIPGEHAAWRFRMRVFIDSKKVFNSVQAVFAPNVDDVVIPLGMKDKVTDMLVPLGAKALTAPDGRLYVECIVGNGRANVAILNRISLRMFPDTTHFVRILSSSLAYTGLLNAQSVHVKFGTRYCPTRIKFSASTSEWILGLPFAASVESVLLDASSASVSFVLTKTMAQRPESVVPIVAPSFALHALPRFSRPAILVQGRQLSVEFSTEWAPVGSSKSFALVSTSPQLEGDEAVFTFVRIPVGIQPFAAEEPKTTELEGTFQIKTLEAKLTVSAGGDHAATFAFTQAADPESRSYAVKLKETANAFQVSLLKVEMLVELQSYAVAKPFHAAEAAEDNCTICIEAIEAGQSVIDLPCGDRFHEDCIAGWLGRTPACANCRAAVPLKPAGKVVLKRAPTPEAEGSDSGDSEDEENEEGEVEDGEDEE